MAKTILGSERTTRKTHGGSKHPLYYIWVDMWRRCTSRTRRFADIYCNRGITVCERWQDPFKFYEDMGPRPSPKHTIDRIDANGNYEPSNCRWATPQEQMRNTRRAKIVTYNGRTACLAEWAEITGISRQILNFRADHGWPVERMLTEKPKRRRRKSP